MTIAGSHRTNVSKNSSAAKLSRGPPSMGNSNDMPSQQEQFKPAEHTPMAEKKPEPVAIAKIMDADKSVDISKASVKDDDGLPGAPHKKQDKSRPVSSTPVPGTPW
jgi:hypothetical protein